MKKITLIAFAALCLAGCGMGITPDNPGPVICPDDLIQMLILNNGNMGSNDASISTCAINGEQLQSDVFQRKNGKKLGDIGQDIIAVGDELYIAMNGSRLIYVTDKELKIKDIITAVGKDGASLSPRCMISAGGSVYVTYYEGFLGKIETGTHEISITDVGNNPEGLAICGNSIYVANSGGMSGFDNTLSVVSIARFEEVQRIKVNLNPQSIVPAASGKYLYVSSWGNYYDVPAKLQVVDTATGDVSDTGYKDVKHIAMREDGTLIVATGGYDENWQVAATIWKHDPSANKELGKFTESTISPYYSLSTDKGLVFVGTSDYKTSGDLFIFDSDGREVGSTDCGGLNPQKALIL